MYSFTLNRVACPRCGQNFAVGGRLRIGSHGCTYAVDVAHDGRVLDPAQDGDLILDCVDPTFMCSDCDADLEDDVTVHREG
jgi:hypothetical protein